MDGDDGVRAEALPQGLLDAAGDGVAFAYRHRRVHAEMQLDHRHAPHAAAAQVVRLAKAGHGVDQGEDAGVLRLGAVLRDVHLQRVAAQVALAQFGFDLFVFFLAGKIDDEWPALVYFDAIGLGVFTGLGLIKASSYGVGIVGMIMSGTFSAVGGGMLRDVFLKEIPIVFTSDFYASASILGGLFGVFLLKYLKVDPESVITITAAVTMTLRIIAYEMHFRLPVAKFDKGDDD